MAYQITFLPGNQTVCVDEGCTILQAALQAGLRPDAPCGGKGTCGKCRVVVLSGPERGSCLACQTRVTGDMVVQLPHAAPPQLLRDHYLRRVPCSPGISGITVQVSSPSLEDARSDWERLQDALSELPDGPGGVSAPTLECLTDLHQVLEASGDTPYVLLSGQRVLRVCPEPFIPLLAAFDIGTTSVVCYLMDGISGETLWVESMLNRQISYGADVISRAEFAIKGGLREISQVIRQEMNELMARCCGAIGRTTDEIMLVSVAGNTCMHHLFAGICPSALLTPPYFPEIREPLELSAGSCGLDVGSGALLRLLPIIAGFVGADTSAAMLASSFDEVDELSLLVDIGTNGELVLGNSRHRVACSTAAGPALEGAKISCGMRGADGAIDHVSLKDGDICYTTIGAAAPAGICGSGLIDLIAVLLQCGVLTRSGRFAKPAELEHLPKLRQRFLLNERGRASAFVLADRDLSATDGPIVLTQGDIREVQLAKGAIAAGIELMCQTLGASPQSIQKVFIAGAFGNYMDAGNACAIGMLPQIDLARMVPVGNAAGAGAQLSALSQQEFYRCGEIARQTEFLELALHPQFQQTFIRHLDF